MTAADVEDLLARALERVRPEYLSRKQLAAELGVSTKTLAEFEAEGLPARHLGPRTTRFIRTEVEEWMRRRTTNGNQ